MINIDFYNETIKRLQRIVEQNVAEADLKFDIIGDVYEVPGADGNPKKVIQGGQEFVLRITVPPVGLPYGAVKVPRVDINARMAQARANEFNMEEE